MLRNQNLIRDYTLIEWGSFYSKKYDACIHTEKHIVGINFFIGDLSRTIRHGHMWFLLNCDEHGVDRVLIDKLRLIKGNEDITSYQEFMDDGNGSLPRSVKAPIFPPTRANCTNIFEQMIGELNK
jgi:hypothetical protein